MADTSFYVYLTSSEDGDGSHKNDATSFTNTMKPSIQLQGDYLVALQDINFNHKFFTIKKGDSRYKLTITLYTQRRKFIKDVIYIPTVDITCKNIQSLIIFLNSDIKKVLLNSEFIIDSTDNLFQYNPVSGFVEYKWIRLRNTPDKPKIVLIGWTFSLALQEILGLEREIFPNRPLFTSPAILPEIKDSLYVYSDLVQFSRVGSQQTSILDVVPLKNTFSRGVSRLAYKHVNKHTIDSISIRITDQLGKDISFHEDTTILITLHFKPFDQTL